MLSLSQESGFYANDSEILQYLICVMWDSWLDLLGIIGCASQEDAAKMKLRWYGSVYIHDQFCLFF